MTWTSCSRSTTIPPSSGCICTTNPIESTFATVRHRTKVTKGPGSRTARLATAFKPIE
jgi:transposase-like protein